MMVKKYPYLLVVIFRSRQLGDGGTWNHQKMGRSLRTDIVEGNALQKQTWNVQHDSLILFRTTIYHRNINNLIILVNKIAWNFFAYYLPKYCITSRPGSLRLLYLVSHFSTSCITSCSVKKCFDWSTCSNESWTQHDNNISSTFVSCSLIFFYQLQQYHKCYLTVDDTWLTKLRVPRSHGHHHINRCNDPCYSKQIYFSHTARYFSSSQYWRLFHLCFGRRS